MNNEKPIIYYVDDEPHNLTVFEASLSGEWTIRTYTNPLEALAAMEKETPWVLVSDQRMPIMNGVAYLELSKKFCPDSIRIVVTGYSEEDLVVDSVRRAQIFDYIKKPWEPDQLEASLKRGIDMYQSRMEAKRFFQELQASNAALEKQNQKLNEMATQLELSHKKEKELREELQCWAPPFLLKALYEEKLTFPVKRDLVGVVFDMIGSHQTHDLIFEGRPLRSMIIQSFSEIILKNGGWRESHDGDSSYGHFGLLPLTTNPYECALATAREFRETLKGINARFGTKVECGISLHIAKDSLIHVHSVHMSTPHGLVTQKSFDTNSVGIDQLHRIEKLVHTLPGTNIIASEEFLSGLNQRPSELLDYGGYTPKAGESMLKLFLIEPSPETLKAKNQAPLKQVA